MNGKALINQIIQASGLPEKPVQTELEKILQNRNLSADTLTLNDLRAAMAEYLQDTLIDVTAEESSS